MGIFAGGALKLLGTVLYAVLFCASGIILSLYSYFLAKLSRNHETIPQWTKAVEGLSGSACLYLIFAILLTCFLGGKSFFAFIGIALDVLFCGAMIAIAVMTRHGTESCDGNNYVRTPLGNGRGNSEFHSGPSLHYACVLNKVCFAVSIIAAGLFLISALLQLFIGRNHQKEKRYGPSPKNNYTSGSGRKFFGRRKGPRTTHDAYARDAEAGAVGGGLAAPAASHELRPSHDTGYTGSTMATNNNTYSGDKYAPPVPATHGGYHNAPTGTAVNNPYGYENHVRPTNF